MGNMVNLIAAHSGKMIVNPHRTFDDMEIPRSDSGDPDAWHLKPIDEKVRKGMQVMYNTSVMEPLRNLVLVHNFEMNLNVHAAVNMTSTAIESSIVREFESRPGLRAFTPQEGETAHAGADFVYTARNSDEPWVCGIPADGSHTETDKLVCHICQRKVSIWQPSLGGSPLEWPNLHLGSSKHRERARTAYDWVDFHHSPQSVQEDTFAHFSHPGFNRRALATRD